MTSLYLWSSAQLDGLKPKLKQRFDLERSNDSSDSRSKRQKSDKGDAFVWSPVVRYSRTIDDEILFVKTTGVVRYWQQSLPDGRYKDWGVKKADRENVRFAEANIGFNKQGKRTWILVYFFMSSPALQYASARKLRDRENHWWKRQDSYLSLIYL